MPNWDPMNPLLSGLRMNVRCCKSLHERLRLTAPRLQWSLHPKPVPEPGAPGGPRTPSWGSRTELEEPSPCWWPACPCRLSQTSPTSAGRTKSTFSWRTNLTLQKSQFSFFVTKVALVSKSNVSSLMSSQF